MIIITAMMPKRIGNVMNSIYLSNLIKKPPKEGVLYALI
jgi:hypothetical protein